MRPPPRRRSDRSDPRREAFAILRRVEEVGAFAGVLLEYVEPRFGDPRDAALLHELVLGVLRRRSLLDHAIARVSSRPLAAIDPPVLTALRLAAYSVLFLDRVPDFAAVSTAVDLVKRAGGRATGFVNGVARSLAREGTALLPPEPTLGDLPALATYHAHPLWWVERLAGRLGPARAAALLAADNLPAPTVLRVRRDAEPGEVARRLEREGVVTAPGHVAPSALRVLSGAPQRTEPFREGLFWIQDEGSQLVPSLLGDRLGPRVLDLCAAPGGKSLVLADTAPDALVVAADRSPSRLRRLIRNVARTGARGVVALAADMAAAPAVAGPFDQLLVDAPCSGTGTLRRHPEIRWRLEPAALAPLAARQRRLLETAASLAGPAGEIVYAVCSLEPEEGEQTIAAFLDQRPDWERRDPRGRLPEGARALVGEDLALRSAPDVGEMDGFFAALLGRRR